jgi:serine/threonine protein kinase/tetratricopeptide (TPR) repeat protein
MLVEAQGKIVTREEIKKKLWPNDTIVDFDHSINVAIGILRKALGDSADNPQYIETLARRGYRFRAAIEWLETAADTSSSGCIHPKSFPGLAGLVGSKVSHYRVLEIIGGGGMGMVYKAEDLKLGRRVALKFLPEDLSADSVALKRFEREAQSASALNHPNICTIHEIEDCGGQPFIVMELLEGESLLEYLNAFESKPIPLIPLLDIAIQICKGLEAAHDKGIIHRDIKPANIFLTQQGPVKILDFGLAKLASMDEAEEKNEGTAAGTAAGKSSLASYRNGGTAELTRTGIAIGTARYMSPEQIRKEQLDARSDLFSCGLVLYEMATGSHAFLGDTEAALHNSILNQTPAPIRTLNPAVPSRLDSVISWAIEKDRSRRYQSAAEMRLDLEKVRRDLHPVRRRLRKFASYGTLALCLAGAGWTYWSYHTRVTLSPSDTIVVADVSNRTGDPILDDALNTALHTELEQTPYFNVLGMDKVFGTLAALGVPIDTKVAQDVARRICLRTNSKMIVDSSISDAGNRYTIELSAIGCQSGSTIARVREDVRARNDIVHELGVAAVRLRRKLGEPPSSIQQFNKPLEVATSASLEALQLLTEGYRHHIVADWNGAIALYQRAIEIDPNLALAYSAMGAAQQAIGGLTPAVAEKKSFDLRERMTLPGQFQVQTGYYDLVTGEREKSSAIYARWLELFPQNIIARINFAHCLDLLGRIEQAASLRRDTVRFLPATAYLDLMRDYIMLDRLDEAKATFDEALAHKVDGIVLRDHRVLLAFLQKDNAAMQEQWNWARGKPDPDYRLAHGRFAVEQYYGQLRKAREEQVFDQTQRSNESMRVYWDASEALFEAEIGNLAEAKRSATNALLADPRNRDTRMLLALVFARTGDVVNAQKLADQLNEELPLDTLAQNYSLPVIQAAIRLHANDPAGAVEALRPTINYELAYPDGFNSIYPAYIRGLAYLQLGDGKKAAVEFQKLLDHRGVVGREVIGALSYLQLGRAERISGDFIRARKSYEEFLTLWKNADPDIPIYKEAKSEYAKLLFKTRTADR